MKYKVYVIQSQQDKRLYVGMSQNVTKRISEHNSGQVFSTKGYRPWRLVYSEDATDRIAARKREKYWKGGSGKQRLKSIINHSAIAQR